MSKGNDDITTTASSEVTDFSGSFGSCVEIEGDGIGEKSLSAERTGFMSQQDDEGDGIGEKTLRNNFDNSIENPSYSMNQQNVEGDGLGEKTLSESFDNSIENPSNLMNQQKVEADGLGENTLSESFENSNENLSNSTNQKDVIGEESLDSAKPEENNPDRRLQNENATDDNGKPYMKDGKLIPNNTYTLNGYEYHTDQYGRITHGEGKVSVNDSPRSSLPPIEGVGKGDDRGHIIAHVLGGADTEGNLVPMDSSLNRGEYKSMELSAKKALDEGKDVKLSVDIEYGDGKRPISFTVTLEVDDDITVKKFYNNAQ